MFPVKPELHAHSFRHFYGTNMYRTTNDLRLVQILLGHARI
ncbi:MAG: tyrosine-type recombinase/integrase [Thermoplasmataceae archaeon]